MKKINLFFAALFLVSNVNFASAEALVNNSDCVDYAYRMAAREGNHYGGFDGWSDWYQSYSFFYDACDEVGGDIADAIFL